MGTLKQRVGEKIRRERERLVLTQAALARAAGTSAPHLAMVESGQRGLTVTSVHKIAQALGLTLSEFFSDERPPRFNANSQALSRLVENLRGRSEEQLCAVEHLIEALDNATAHLVRELSAPCHEEPEP